MQKKIRYIVIAELAALCVGLLVYSALSIRYKTTDGLQDNFEIILVVDGRDIDNLVLTVPEQKETEQQ